MWNAIGRILVVTAAFILAIATGLISLFIIGSRWAAQEIASQAQNGADAAFAQFWGILAFAVTAGPVLSLLPALALVIIGELARIRSVFYYLVGGGVAAALMPVMARPEHSGAGAALAEYLTIFATAGFAAGLVYWLIAGRNA